jgi:hypothetical protein
MIAAIIAIVAIHFAQVQLRGFARWTNFLGPHLLGDKWIIVGGIACLPLSISVFDMASSNQD